MIKDLILKNRSYRKFQNNRKIEVDTLEKLVDLARTTPSSKNLQPLRYILVTDEGDVDFVFSQLKWAWYLKTWEGPAKEERPPAYIIMCIDTNVNEKALIDSGISAQTILLGATELGMGGCIIRTVNGYKVSRHFELPSNIEIVQVIALGYPDQNIQLTEISDNEPIEYFEDESGTHFVPKRKLEDIILYKKG